MREERGQSEGRTREERGQGAGKEGDEGVAPNIEQAPIVPLWHKSVEHETVAKQDFKPMSVFDQCWEAPRDSHNDRQHDDRISQETDYTQAHEPDVLH